MARVALLIGTKTYAEGLSSLPSAPRDVEAISTVLCDPEMGGFERVETLIDEYHTTIAARIETWFRERQKDDLALLYISGHGVKDDQSNLYFAAKDTRKHGEKLLRATAVAASFVRDCIRESRAKRQVIILDCCFSGAIGDQLPKGYETINLEPLLRADDSEALLGAEGRVILTSSSSIQYSFEQREGPLSIYTHYLVEGIRTGAADTNGNGAILVQELHNYASRKVQEESPAMTPKIIVLRDEGYRIRIAKAPLGDPKLIFRKELEERVRQKRGKLSSTNQREFEVRRQELKLSPSEAQSIEDEVLQPYRILEAKLADFEQEVKEIKKIEDLQTIAERLDDLKYLQLALKLRDEDVTPILSRYSLYYAATSTPESGRSDISDASLVEDDNGILGHQKSYLRKILLGAALLLGVFVVGRTIIDQQIIRSPIPPESPTPVTLEPVQDLISAGDNVNLYGSRSSSRGLRNLVGYRDDLIKGIDQFVEGNYEQSLAIFKNIRENARGNEFSDSRKDPELLIFQNNSQARWNHKKQIGSPIYTIAAAVPLSDADEGEFNFGQQILFGIAHAQSKAIEQGINLEVVIANDRNLPEQGEELAKELSKPNTTGYDNIQRNILAVIGHYSSSVTCSALHSYNEAGLPVISPASTRTGLRSACGGEKVFFRTVSSSDVEAQALVDYLVEESGIDNPKIAAFYKKGEGYSQTLFEEFKEALGDGTQMDEFDLSNPLNFEKANFNVLAVFPDGLTSDRSAFDRAINEVIIKDAGSSLILGSNPLYSSPAIIDSRLSNKLGVQPDNPDKGLVLATDWFPGCGSNNNFAREAANIWGGPPNRIYALSYEATQVLIDRLTRGKTTRASILDDLSNSEHKINSDVFKAKTISFNQHGDRNEIENRILVTPRPKGGELEPVPREQSCSL
ncbi:caspase family protein [Phormidium tenue FACHB-886]|nr:caspase family protein [Phormidium tenue FACHB-886]